MATGDSRSKQSGTTRPSGTTAKAQTKSPIGPGSGYLQPKTTTQKTPFDPKSLTKSNKQIVETIKNRGTTVTDTSKGTGKDTGKDKGIAPLTFTDTDNGDGTITRRYSDGTVEIIAGGRGVGQGTDPATTELLRRDEANRKSAFKVLEDTFNSYGLGSLVPVVRTFMEQGLSDDEAVIQLRQTPEYKQRFLGKKRPKGCRCNTRRAIRQVVMQWRMWVTRRTWVRYIPHMREVNAEQDYELGEGVQDDDDTEVGEVETPEATEEVVYEEVQCDHVSWKDWLTNPAREWAEVRWVARRVYMTRAELTERFGKDMAKNVPITTTSTGTDTASDAQKQSSQTGEVYEIWDKPTKMAYWVCKGYTGGVLDKREDPLGLTNFFPCPPPLNATLQGGSVNTISAR